MGYRAGDTYYGELATYLAGGGSGAPDSGSLEIYQVRHNGAADASFLSALSINSSIVAGIYEVSGVIPAGYNGGDTFCVIMFYTVTSVGIYVPLPTVVIDRLPALQKNAAFGFSFRMFQNSAPYTAGYTGGSVSGTRTLSGGSSSAVSGTITQIASTNEYYFAGAAADSNSGEVHFAFTASGALPVYITLNPSP